MERKEHTARIKFKKRKKRFKEPCPEKNSGIVTDTWNSLEMNRPEGLLGFFKGLFL